MRSSYIFTLKTFLDQTCLFVAKGDSKDSESKPKPDPNPSPNNFNTILLAKINQGAIAKFHAGSGNVTELSVQEFTYGVTAFDYYLDKTIFYGTTKPQDPIKSPKGYTDFLAVSEPWRKTALAVDFVSGKIYVIDSETGQLNIIDLLGRNYGVVSSDLDELRDIVLDPERRLMFILESSSVK